MKLDMKLDHKQNLLSATISLFGIYSSLTHNYENEIMTLFVIYYLNDIKKKTMKELDFIIHHLLGISILFLGLYIKHNNLPTDQWRQIILNLEMTTPIYILSLYFDNLKIIFFISFMYCRIYKNYFLLNTMEYQHVYILYYGLFALNLYWFTIMLKKISKPFKDPKYIFCHKIIPFIRPIQFNLFNFYSTLSTYLYHEDIYTAIMNDTNMEQYTSPQTMVHSFVNSMVSISSIEPCYYKYSIPVHLCKYIFALDDAIPFGVDVYFYFSTDALIIYYIWILFRTIKPMYNLNPLAVHTLLLILRQYSKV